MQEREWDLKHLGQAVLRARVAKGYRTRRDFALAARVGTRSLDSLEAGTKVGPKTYAAVENALGWEPGTVERIALRQADTPAPDAPAPGTLEWFRDLRRTLPEDKFFEVVDQMTRAKAKEVSTQPSDRTEGSNV